MLFVPFMALSETNMETADEYLRIGEIKQAAKYYQKALKDTPDSVDALVGIAHCNLKNGYDEMAQERITHALRVNNHDPSALYVQGKILLHNKEYASAKDTLQTLLSLDSEYLDAYPLLSSTLYSLGDPQGADEIFEIWKSKQTVNE